MAAAQIGVRSAISSVLGDLDGYSALKNEQTEALEAFVDGKDVLALLPTGFGKSLIYQLAPLVFKKLNRPNSIFVVVSPLVALIEDQLREAAKLGVKAIQLGGSDDEGIKEGKYELVFASPERLVLQDRWRDMLASPVYQEHLAGIVVDEVHITYKWGQGSKGQPAFRESFSRLGELRSIVREGTPVLALTASADLQSTKKVVKILNMEKAKMVTASPNRTNIRLSLVPISYDKLVCLEWVVKEIRSKGLEMENIIIYCRSLKTVGKVFCHLKSQLGADAWVGERCVGNLLIGMFHSATLKKHKDRVVDSLLGRGTCKVVVATTALGMGVNFKTVNRIILFGPPEDTEDILQMVGRAGRDGKKAHAVMYYYPLQLVKADKAVKEFVEGKSETCLRKRLYGNFEENPMSVTPGHDCCSNCHRECACPEAESVCPVPFPEHESFVNNIKLPSRTRDVDDSQRALLRENLEEYKESLSHHAVSLFTTDVECTGFSTDLIDSVVEHCHRIFTLHYVNTLPVYNVDHAKEILLIVSEVFGDIEDIDRQLGEDVELEVSDNEAQEDFDYKFSGYFDEGLVFDESDEDENDED